MSSRELPALQSDEFESEIIQVGEVSGGDVFSEEARERAGKFVSAEDPQERLGNEAVILSPTQYYTAPEGSLFEYGETSGFSTPGSQDFDFQYGETSASSSDHGDELVSVQPHDLRLMRFIGRGYCGEVWVGIRRIHRDFWDEFHEVAVKKTEVQEEMSEELLIMLKAYLTRCKLSPGVFAVNLNWPLGIAYKGEQLSLIFQLFERSVADVVETMSFKTAMQYARDIAKAVQRLHACGLVVLNLKPASILLDSKGDIVLADFGIAHLLMKVAGKLSVKSSPHYMAPEQWEPLLFGPVHQPTDSWNFACTCIEMFGGSVPWSGMTSGQIYEAVVTRRAKPTIPKGLSEVVVRLLESCLSFDPRARPSFNEILRDLTLTRDAPDEREEEEEGEVAESSLVKGEWVKLREATEDHSNVGLVLGVDERRRVAVGLAGRPVAWEGSVEELERVPGMTCGVFVRLREDVPVPRFEWPKDKDGSALVGKVTGVLYNGVLHCRFSTYLPLWKTEQWYADPDQVEATQDWSISNHWLVGPCMIGMALLLELVLKMHPGA